MGSGGGWAGGSDPAAPMQPLRPFSGALARWPPPWSLSHPREGRGVYRSTGVQSHCLRCPRSWLSFPKGSRCQEEGEGGQPYGSLPLGCGPEALVFLQYHSSAFTGISQAAIYHPPSPSVPSSQHLDTGQVGGGAGRGLSPTRQPGRRRPGGSALMPQPPPSV